MADAKLDQERRITGIASALFLFAAVSGVFFFLTDTHTLGRQWVLVLHILVGSGFAFLMLPYVPIHYLRSAYFRRPTLIVSGLFAVATLLALIISGVQLAAVGHQEHWNTPERLHLLSGGALIAVLVIHLVDHFVRMPQQRKQQYPNRFLTFQLRQTLISGLFSLGVVSLLIVGGLLIASPPEAAQPVVEFDPVYGEHPFRPSQTETSHGGFVTESQIAGSDQCAACHQDIAQQWSASLHRQAASDPTYVTNVNLLEAKKGIAATRYCEGCHAPVALLTGALSKGGQHGGVTGTIANREGVSCLSCHGTQRMVHLKGVASFEFGPRTPYLFDDSANVIGVSLNQLVIRADPAQHKKDMAPAVLREPAMCAGCHAQFMDKDMNGWGWVKMQDEYSAWLAGPFSGHESEFASGNVKRCQDCHMPRVKATDPSADANGMVASHHFPGGNTVVPLLAGDKKQLQATIAMLQNNGLRLTINRPNRTNAQRNLRPLNEQIRGATEAPYYVYLNEEVSLDVIVANQAVGHDFPAGTIDLGEAWIDFTVMDAEGDAVFRSGGAGLGEPLPLNTHVYKSTAVDRQGREVWRHDLFNMVGESFRRVIPAGDADLANYRFRVPSWVKTPLSITATLKYRKLNERYATFALGENYVPVPIVDMAWDSLQVSVRTRMEVDQND